MFCFNLWYLEFSSGPDHNSKFTSWCCNWLCKCPSLHSWSWGTLCNGFKGKSALLPHWTAQSSGWISWGRKHSAVSRATLGTPSKAAAECSRPTWATVQILVSLNKLVWLWLGTSNCKRNAWRKSISNSFEFLNAWF